MYSYNCLLQWHNTTDSWVERVLWIDDKNDEVVVFRIELDRTKRSHRKWPFIRTKSELNQALADSTVRILAKDSFCRPAPQHDDLSDEDRAYWQQLKDALAPIINDPERRVFAGRLDRRGLVTAVAKKAGVNRSTIYSLLVKYWAGGQTPQCLLPDYRGCGGQSRQSKGGKKRGKLNEAEIEAGHRIGIPLTREVFDLLHKGRDEFYRKEAMTLKLAYQLTLGKYFNDDYGLKNNAWVPVLKPADELPDFSQFLYVHDLTAR